MLELTEDEREVLRMYATLATESQESNIKVGPEIRLAGILNKVVNELERQESDHLERIERRG